MLLSHLDGFRLHFVVLLKGVFFGRRWGGDNSTPLRQKTKKQKETFGSLFQQTKSKIGSGSNPVRFPLFLWKLTLGKIFLRAKREHILPLCLHFRLLAESCTHLRCGSGHGHGFEKIISIVEP